MQVVAVPRASVQAAPVDAPPEEERDPIAEIKQDILENFSGLRERIAEMAPNQSKSALLNKRVHCIVSNPFVVEEKTFLSSSLNLRFDVETSGSVIS